MDRLLFSFLVLFLWGAVSGIPIPKNGESDTKIRIPAMAQKAGGRLRPELMTTISEDTNEENEVDQLAPKQLEKSDEYYDQWDYPGSSEELDCPEEMFYHIRGRQCVPLRCPGGNKWRNQKTGECIYDEYNFGTGTYGGRPRCVNCPSWWGHTVSRALSHSTLLKSKVRPRFGIRG